MSVNNSFILGNVGKDPVIRALPNGGRVMEFSVATTERWTAQAGEKVEKTEWHNVVVFGKQVDWLKERVSKGIKVYVEGPLKYNEYQNKDGANVRKAFISARKVEIFINGAVKISPAQDDGVPYDESEENF